MTFLQAAVTVLESAGRAMTADEITAEALRQGLISRSGKTPTATMSAELYMNVRENPRSRLVRQSDPGPNRARRGSVRWMLRK